MIGELKEAAALPRNLALAMLVLALVGAGAALTGQDDAAPVLARLGAGVGLGVIAGLLLGALQSLAFGVLVVLARRFGVDAWWAAANSREDERGPTLRLRAALLAGAIVLPLFAAFAWLVIPRLLAIDDAKFARSFGVVLLAGGALGSVVGAAALARACMGLLARIDARVRLPWPPAPLLRYALFVLAPLGTALPWYLLTNNEALGTFALPFWLLVVLAVEGGLAIAWAKRPEPARLLGGALAVVVVGSLGAHLCLARSPATASWAKQDRAVSVTLALASKLSDLDRDGFSPLFGGGDCAPFDAAINPKRSDVPGNGVDEDCSGEDAVALASARALERYSGAYQAPSETPPNVVFVIIDAVRSDYTGFGGAKRSPTPYLDQAAKDCLVFERAYAQSSATMMSIPSMLSGRDPSKIEWVPSEEGLLKPGPSEQMLSARLEALGYDTYLVGEWYFDKRMRWIWDEYQEGLPVHGPPKAKRNGPMSAFHKGRAAQQVVETIHYLEQAARKQRPAFLTLYIPDPHSDYYPKHKFGLKRFGKEPEGLYKSEIAYADRALGSLLYYLTRTGQWDNTIFVVVADHGEEFGEHGGKQHARTCYVESIHVPLLMHIPGVEGQKLDAPVALIDVVPTILEAIGATDTDAVLDGQSLLIPALTPERAPSERTVPCAVISQRARQGNFFRRAARRGDALLIHNVLAQRYEYYDRGADPEELDDLYIERGEDAELGEMRDWLRETMTGTLPQQLLTE